MRAFSWMLISIWLLISATMLYTENTPRVLALEPAAINPQNLTRGLGNGVWFTDSNGKIGRLTTTGELSLFALPHEGSRPLALALGPDRAFWFTETHQDHAGIYPIIGRITVTGTITEYELERSADQIITGPDGNLWFSERSSNHIGRLSRDGTLSFFSLPNIAAMARKLTIGPDGAIWFTQENSNLLGRIDIRGTISEHALPVNTPLTALTVGADGALWVAAASPSVLIRFPLTGMASVHALADPDRPLAAITGGPDGNIWYIRSIGDSIGRFTATGENKEWTPGVALRGLDIISGPDDRLWFILNETADLSSMGMLGRITTDGMIDYPYAPPPDPIHEIDLAPDTAPAHMFIGPGELPMCMGSSGAVTTVHHDGSTTTTPLTDDGLPVLDADAKGSCLAVLDATNTSALPGITTTCYPGMASMFAARSPMQDTLPRTRYELPAGSDPQRLRFGPDAAIWFTAPGLNAIGRLDTGGKINLYPIPSPNSTPFAISVGQDNALWFTEQGGHAIGRIEPGGAVQEFALPASAGQPFDITAGPDMALWFTTTDHSIGRIALNGQISMFPLSPTITPRDLVAGGDQALWFIDQDHGTVLRMDLAGLVYRYPLPHPDSGLSSIAAAADGTLWFTETGRNTIGQLTPPALPIHLLALSSIGNGNVTISPAEGRTDEERYFYYFDTGTAITLTAKPMSKSAFVGWGGACAGTQPCTIRLNQDTRVSATFIDQGDAHNRIYLPYIHTISAASDSMRDFVED